MPTAREPAPAGDLFVPSGSPTSDGEPDTPAPRAPAPDPPVRRSGATAAAWLVCAVLGVLAVVRVALAAGRLPARPGEADLVDGAYAALYLRGVPAQGGGATEIVARAQISAYAQLTGAFQRWPDVLDGARELSVVAFAGLLAAVFVACRRGGPLPVAVGVALFVVVDVAVETFAVVGPGQLGLAWLSVATALALRRSRPARVVAAAAAVIGVLTAPLLIVVVVAVIVLVVVLVVAVLVSVGAGGAGTGPVAVVGVAVVATTLGGVLALSGVVPNPPSGAVPDALRPLLVLGALVAAAALTRAVPAGRLPVGLRRGLAAVAVVGWVVLAIVSTVTARPEVRVRYPHADLAAWIMTVTAPPTTVAAPPGVRSDLLRDGVPADRLRADGTLVVRTGNAQGGLARFGAGSAQLGVGAAGPDTTITTILERESRTTAGLQLAGNPRLTAPDSVRDTLSAGGVDSRALVILSGLAGRGPIWVTDLPVVPGEEPALPRHRVAVVGLAPADLEWLRAQQPPFAPTITPTPDGVTMSWTLPAPPAVLNR